MPTRPPRPFSLAVAFACLAAGGSGGPHASAQILETDEFEIVYRLEAGQRLRYDCTSYHRTESELVGIRNLQTREEIETRLLEVLEASGGTFRVRVTYERYRLGLSFLVGNRPNPAVPEIRFDSAGLSPEDLHEAARKNPLLSTALKFLGKSYEVRFTKHGEILGVDGMKEFYRDAVMTLKDVVSEAQFERIVHDLIQQGSERHTDAIRIAFSFLPGQRMRLGETWKSHWVRNYQLHQFRDDATFTLDEVTSDRMARISYRSEVTSSMVPAVGMEFPPELGFEVTDTHGDGNLVFDLDAGRLVRFEARLDARIGNKVPDDPELARAYESLRRPEFRDLIRPKHEDRRIFELIEVFPPRSGE